MNRLDLKVTAFLAWRMLRHGRISARKIVNLLGNLWAMRTGRPVAAALPSIVVLEPARFCNLACAGCGYEMRGLMNRKESLSFDSMKKLIDEVKGSALIIAAHLAGEPFLNPELIPILRYISRQKLNLILNSNGNFHLTDTKWDELVDSGLDVLFFSISGMTQATYGAYHRNGRIDLVLANIEALEEAKRRRGASTPKVILRYLEHDHNRHEISQAAAFARRHKLFALDVRRIEPEYKPEEFARAKEALAARTAPPLDRCNSLWLVAEIKTSGDVMPCCYEWYDIPFLGNVFTGESLAAVWNGERYQSLRKMFLDPASPKLPACYLCRMKVGFQDLKDAAHD